MVIATEATLFARVCLVVPSSVVRYHFARVVFAHAVYDGGMHTIVTSIKGSQADSYIL